MVNISDVNIDSIISGKENQEAVLSISESELLIKGGRLLLPIYISGPFCFFPKSFKII
jgi:hypothetical protein